MRVEADFNETTSLFRQTLVEGTAAHSRRKETQPDFKYGALIEAETHDSIIHGSDSEQTLIDHDASINYENNTRPDILRGKLGLAPASSANIDEPFNRQHEQGQHGNRLKSLSVQAVAPSDASFITAIIDRAADLQDFFQTPASWALACGVEPDNLANIALKPLGNGYWLLTATVS